MYRSIVVLFLISCSGYPMKIAVTTTSALIACDVAQTVQVSDGGRYDRMDPRTGRALVETNPMLGDRPPVPLLIAVGLADLGVNYAVYRSGLPAWVKWTWYAVVGAAETYAVTSNARVAGACGIVGVPSLEHVDR